MRWRITNWAFDRKGKERKGLERLFFSNTVSERLFPLEHGMERTNRLRELIVFGFERYTYVIFTSELAVTHQV